MFDTIVITDPPTQNKSRGRTSKATASSFRLIPFESTGMKSTKGHVYGGDRTQDRISKMKLKTDQGITSHAFKYESKVMDALEWLKIARSTKDETGTKKECLMFLNNMPQFTYGSDGYRIHLVRQEHFAPLHLTFNGAALDINQIIPTHHDTTIQVSKYDVIRAIATCIPFAKETNNILRMCVTPNELQFAAQCAEWGDASASIVNGDQYIGCNGMPYYRGASFYKLDGNPTEIAFDYRLLQEALRGMPEIFTMGLNSPSAPGHIWSDIDGIRREAVVMPMHIGR